MNNLVIKTVLGGVIGTIILTIMAFFVAPMMGVKMDPPAMLSMKFHVPILVGWVMHFMMGIMFAFAYMLIIRKLLHTVSNIWIKGIIFGGIIFMVALVGMYLMGALHPALMNVMALMMAHFAYGIGVVKTIGE